MIAWPIQQYAYGALSPAAHYVLLAGQPKNQLQLGKSHERKVSLQKLPLLLERLKHHPLLSVRKDSFQQLQPFIDDLYSAKTKIQANKALNEMNERLERYGTDVQSAIRDLRKEGYTILFKNDLVPLANTARDILRGYHFDPDEINQIMSSAPSVTAGDLLKEHGERACFMPGKKPRSGTFLFSTSEKSINAAQFWHELFHAIQHQNGFYNDLKNNGGVYWLHELEASGFVISNAKRLKLQRHQVMFELRIWALRLGEYIDYMRSKQRPGFSRLA